MGRSVDILLPTCERPHTIGYSIESVLRQTHSDFQLHIVGDGCDAETEAVVRGFGDPRVKFYRFEKAHGYGYVHRNTVLRDTAGSYVAYASDDDLWLPDHLDIALHELETRGVDLVALRSCHVQFPDRLDPFFFAFDWGLGGKLTFLRNWFMGAVNCVHRRAVFSRVGYWNEHLTRFGDREFFNRVRCSGVRWVYLDHVTVLRFYARHWDNRYRFLSGGPPQKRYIHMVGDKTWCEELRAWSTQPGRPLVVRRRQWSDFMRFAVGSGPKFVRFWFQRLRSSPGH